VLGARPHGACARTTLYLKHHCANRRHQGCQHVTRDFGTSPILGQLSGKPLLASTKHLGCRDVKHNGV
jgi:hypothetical protein